MQTITLESGLTTTLLNKKESENLFNLICATIDSSSVPFYTPKLNNQFFYVKKEIDYNDCKYTISTNGKTIVVEGTVLNIDKKVISAVNKANK